MQKHVKKGHCSKITFHAKLSKTLMNLEANQLENHYLTRRQKLNKFQPKRVIYSNFSKYTVN